MPVIVVRKPAKPEAPKSKTKGKTGAKKSAQPTSEVPYLTRATIKVGDVWMDAKGDSKGAVVRALVPETDSVVYQIITPQGRDTARMVMSAYEFAEVVFYPIQPPYDGWVKRVLDGRKKGES